MGAAIVKAVKLAQADLKAVSLTSGVGQEFNVAYNRRYFMKDGSVNFNPMFLNPNIVLPAGPIDADVGFVLLKDKATGTWSRRVTGTRCHRVVAGAKQNALMVNLTV